MKVTLNWLKEFVPIDTPAAELASRITLSGPEVVSVKPVGVPAQSADKVLLARALETSPHPNADRLTVVKASDGKTTVTVITNSPNVSKGDFLMVALPGAKLHSGMTVGSRELKGLVSEGMILARESLNIEEKSDDIWILGRDEKKARELFQAYAQDDVLLDIELTANRSDCLSVIGIAREAAAILGLELTLPKAAPAETLDETPSVEIRDALKCPRYSARILRGVRIDESPAAVRRKLELCGIRPINNIVDATNLVLLEYGHPMHSFDLDRLEGGRIVVRGAAKGEKFTTLDGKTHALADTMAVIADGSLKAVALAGIMGGENSEIVPGTANILLESAFFDPVTIRGAAKKLGIRTESSYRFERTADWDATVASLARCAELILATCPDAKLSKLRDEYTNPVKDRVIIVKSDFVSGKLGVPVAVKDIESILKRLQFEVLSRREDSIEVRVPTFRSDVSTPIDIVEEVARIYGYNNIPQPMYKPPVDAESLQTRRDPVAKFRELLSARGFTEAYNFSFSSDPEMKRLRTGDDQVLPLANPLSADASCMRNHLVIGLLRSVEYNVRNAYRDRLRFYEVGRTFRKDGPGYEEKKKIGFVIYEPEATYYSATGTMETLLERIGPGTVTFGKAALPFLHPTNSAVLSYNGREIGYAGEIHPDVVGALDLKRPVFAGEIETEALQDELNRPVTPRPVSKFPPTTRDLTIVVVKSVLGRDVMNAIAGFDPMIAGVRFTDLYQGMQIGENKNSLTFAITLQSRDKTLTDTEANGVMDRLVKKLVQQFGAELRS